MINDQPYALETISTLADIVRLYAPCDCLGIPILCRPAPYADLTNSLRWHVS